MYLWQNAFPFHPVSATLKMYFSYPRVCCGCGLHRRACSRTPALSRLPPALARFYAWRSLFPWHFCIFSRADPHFTRSQQNRKKILQLPPGVLQMYAPRSRVLSGSFPLRAPTAQEKHCVALFPSLRARFCQRTGFGRSFCSAYAHANRALLRHQLKLG